MDQFSDRQRAEWDRTSWVNGACNPLLLAELRTRADAYRALSETPYDGWVTINEDASDAR